MLDDPIGFSDYIGEINSTKLPNHVKELLEPGILARRIEAESIPDALVNIFKILSPISDNPENYLNYLFSPISNPRESSIILRYKKQIIVLEREISIIEKNYQLDKPLIKLANNTIEKNNKRIRTLQESCTKHSEEDKKRWKEEAEHIRQVNPKNNSASMLAREVVGNLGLPVENYESIRKYLLTQGIKAHEKKKSKSVK